MKQKAALSMRQSCQMLRKSVACGRIRRPVVPKGVGCENTHRSRGERSTTAMCW